MSDGGLSMDSFDGLPKGMKARTIEVTNKIMSSGKDPFECDYIGDIGSSTPHFREGMAPTLTATRCKQRGYWSTKRFRRLSIPEMMRLQGADFTLLRGWEDVISENQMGEIVGNDAGLVLLLLPLARASTEGSTHTCAMGGD